ncbi:PREDICTED: sacsin-like isoform X1 [Acropora digitifera]|uniref:sacsin-like isoform X1 n=1 Tax=Acropora digitifera TaxID=70779 RepID=UPI00077AB256|nr:PREDICTED: sacsin-like isoform X1 [Acropora digitifera]XP_015767811.1 PREDICTED: sacsin-like isoform X1 [Acropora digitifera]XP_015767812.1 PREDICTED: sacsin-like isoform X1 [Acropora digitifera]XP_015767813.1 PREDICTED: sacsin-like isoform X1 [Acropora digitifera]
MMEDDEIGEEFGQEEPLTRRLSRLLEDYTDGFAIAKELIQNADDAGATEVRFLYDERTNEDALTCLIDAGMVECQGPALWVFNDAEFRDEDFQNITKLSGGTKELHTEKIGKFGLGFNAVYNLTDVPMILSRNYFVVLDPNKFHLGKVIRDKSKPGIKIDLNKHPNRLRSFRNQFKPFNGIFGCDLNLDKKENCFPGTLFRFPLRTKVQSLRSEIKQEPYDSTKMRELLEIFVRGAKTLLLFTQNVLRVRIFHLARGSMEQTHPQLMFEVKKSLSQVGVVRGIPISVTLPEPSKNISNNDLNFLKQSNFLKASSQIAKHSITTRETGSDLLSSALAIDVSSTFTEDGTCFFGGEHQFRNAVESWLVASSMGKGQAMQLSEKYSGLLPSAGVAVQLLRNECQTLVPLPVLEHSVARESRHWGAVFCYLPLPIHSGLPVHVNGAFAVDSNRRHLKKRTEDDKPFNEVDWNSVLLKDSVCSAYVDLLKDLQLIAEMSPFCLLWPKACDVKPGYEPLALSFYQEVSNGNHAMFSDGKTWANMDQVVFLEPNFRNEPQIGDTSFDVFRILVGENEMAVDLPIDVFQSFIRYGDEEKVKSRLYSRERFFSDLVFPKIASIPPRLRDELVLYAIDEKNGNFDEMLEKYACIPASPNGQTLKCPRELVNPEREVALLFGNEDQRFPWGTKTTFLNSLRIAKLEELGMMSNDLPWSILEERAESISILSKESSETALKRTEALLDLLTRKLTTGKEKSLPEGIQNRLMQAEFLPVAKRPMKFPLPWKGNDRLEKGQTMISPNQAFPYSKRNLVSCSEPMVDVEHLHVLPSVSAFLGIDKKLVTIDHVLTQLRFAATANVDKFQYEELEKLKQLCLESYKYLQTAVDNEEIGEERIHQEIKTIFIERKFVDADQVAFDLARDCQPYLYRLPEEIAVRFERLMKVLGVKKTLQRKDFVASLKRMKTTFGQTVTDTKTIQVATHLACELATCIEKSEREDYDDYEVIYLPDSQGVMRPTSDLCLNNCPWLPAEVDTFCAHGMIPLPTSITLGVKTRREEALKNFAVGIPFGQAEKLTNRLQRILSSYPCEKEILKELLQNADDAGATEICFIKDPRQHSDKRIFADSWKALQGPALCVYNNKPFTESDIKGIQNLGDGSKGDDPNKTGQYGVGFNAVYHLTDVPSFFSSGDEIGDVLCVFDPHCKYVPGATKEAPGQMFKEATKLKAIFPDVFLGYLQEHFPIQNSTMFRFPLRTSNMAKESKISQTPVVMEGLEKMMDALKGELYEALLFLNNLRKITLCEIDQNGEVVNSYFVEAHISGEDSATRQQFAAYVKECGQSREMNDASPVNATVEKCSYVLLLRDSYGYEEKWLIVQQIGFEKDVEPIIVQAYQKNELGMLPRGGVACPLGMNPNEQKESETKGTNGKAYCFLPLPVETELPVHINGHFALEHEARRNLWPVFHDDHRRHWNFALVTDVITSCYLTLLDEVRSFHHLPLPGFGDRAIVTDSATALVSNMNAYEKLFPDVTTSDNSYWTALARSVYQEMDRQALRLFPVLKQEAPAEVQVTWLPPTGEGKDEAFFSNLETIDFLNNEETMLFKQVLLQTGFNMVAFSWSICRALEQSKVKPSCISPSAVLEFFKSFSREFPLCKIGPIPVKVTETPLKNASIVQVVLKYCRKDEQFLKRLSGVPLLLTEDNYLRTFSSEDPKFLTRHHHLLPECKEMFVHKSIRTHIFSDSESIEASVFKQFDIRSFADNLHQTLPKTYFRVTSNEYRKWNPNQEEIPNHDWILKVWNFLSENVNDVLKKSEKQKQEAAQASKEIPNEWSKGEVEVKLSKEEKISKTRGALEPLNNWCILPCTFRSLKSETRSLESSGTHAEHFLVPLKRAESALNLISGALYLGSLVEVLRILSLPEVDYKVLTDLFETASRLSGSLETPASLLRCFEHKLMVNPQSLEGKLGPDESKTVLKYFSDRVGSLQPNEKISLKRLPFYETREGKLVSIDKHETCVVPNFVPKSGMHNLQNQAGMVFLKDVEELSALFEFLALESRTVTDIYCKVILRYFHVIPAAGRIHHLEFLRQIIQRPSFKPEDESRNQILLDRLKDTAILPDRNGRLKTTSWFYDEHNEVFKIMLPQDRFLPKQFRTPVWRDFWKSIGLIHEVSRSDFKTFASDLAREGARMRTKRTDEKSKVLIKHLFCRENLIQERLLEDVCGIKFVTPKAVDAGLRHICRQFGESGHSGHQPYISFKGSVLQEHEKIVWTTATLLPEWANPWNHRYQISSFESIDDYGDVILAHLQVVKPTIDLVTFHCRNVCCQQQKENEREGLSSDHISTRVSVMDEIYKFLQAEGPSTIITNERLRDIPCVLVERGKRFVKTEQVVISLGKELEIQPFLYGLPEKFTRFMELFEYLGCSRSVKSIHYAIVLDMLRKNCSTDALEPNEKTRVLQALKGFFETLNTESKEQTTLPSLHFPAIYVFDHTSKDSSLPMVLREANSLLFDDAPHYHDRLTNFHELFVVDLKMVDVRCKSRNYKDLVMFIPEALRPKMLSSVVEERFVDQRDSTERYDFGAASSLRKNLHSDYFYRGVVRLIRHASHEHHEEVDEHLIDSLKSRLRNIQVHGMKKIVTHLVFKNIPITGSEAEVPYFVEKICHSEQDARNIYINATSDEETKDEVALTLAEVIVEACRGLLHEAAIYIHPMLCMTPEKIFSFLDKRKIRQINSFEEEMGNIFPLPGSFIPIAEHHLLNPTFEVFKSGEYVGYELEDPSLDNEEGDATFIYAVIIEEVTHDDYSLLNKRYKINIGDERVLKIASATDLYKFYRLQEIVGDAIIPSKQQGDADEEVRRGTVFKEISKTIEEAWGFPEAIRRNVIKRLTLQWHPDRNPGNEEFCTKVFQHIMNEIEIREKEGTAESERQDIRRYHHSGCYSGLFSFWGARAGQYKSRLRDYQDSYYELHGSWNHHQTSWEVPPSFCSRNPQPREAQRWLRQASADLEAVDNDINSEKPSYEWACFKCHQAAEKALKAVQYSRDAYKTNVHNLVQNSSTLEDSMLVTLSRDLEGQLGDSTRMRYPDQIEFPRIPNDDYTEEKARHAKQMATEILHRVQDKIA